MKRPNREINIFSLSALDLFASALGAFILLAVIQFPYTKKNEDIVEAKREAEQQLQQCKADLQKAKTEAEQCKERLKETFLAIVFKWDTQKQDVDLHVIDPAGNEFFYKKHNRERNDFPSVDAEISVDQQVGPGVEVWEYYKAVSGTYKIYANLFDRHGNSANPKIKTAVYYRDGVKKLQEKTLTQAGENQKVLLGTIKVNADGEVEIE